MIVSGLGLTFEMPSDAQLGWLLPGLGGPVAIRGYNTYRSRPYDLTDDSGQVVSGWALDEAFVPTVPSTGSTTDGPYGRLWPGMCVIYVGLVRDGGPEPLVWFPERVISVEEPRKGWQTVHSAQYITDQFEDPKTFQSDLQTSDPLQGDARRRVLEVFCQRRFKTGQFRRWKSEQF